MPNNRSGFLKNIKAQYDNIIAVNIEDPSYVGGRGSHGSVGGVLCVNTGPVLQAGAVLYPQPGLSRWLVSAPITSLLQHLALPCCRDHMNT